MSSTTDLSNLDLQVSSVRGTGALTVPAGTNVQRPDQPEVGMVRWNTSTNKIEYYGPDKWNLLLDKEEIEDRFVEMAAPKINAPLDAQGFKLTNIGAPTANADAVNLGFLNQRLSSGQAIDASTLGGQPPYYYASQADLTDILDDVADVQTNLNNHIADSNNPHAVTKEQVGLGQADNTSDMQKPVSTAQQAALNTKVSRSGDVMEGPLSMGYQNLVDIMNFVGMVVYFACENPPAGFLTCNGAAVSRTNYARLFSRIGTTYGAGDGSTTFNLPDLRGMFVRGWAPGGYPTDPGRALGSFQTDTVKAHGHTVTDNGHTHTGIASAQGSGHTHTRPNLVSYRLENGKAEIHTAFNNDNVVPTGTGGEHTHSITIDKATSGISIAASGDAETRPINRALLACIMY